MLWGFSAGECKHYIELRKRQTLFREAVITVLCGRDKPQIENEYCSMCRTAAKRSGRIADCMNCTKDIKAVKD